MNLDEILTLWKSDTKVEITDLANESAKVPSLHAKYYELYSKENYELTKLEQVHHQLVKLKTDYYGCRISDEELKALKWEPFDIKVLRQDMDMYIDADKDIIKSLLNVARQKEKVDLLKDILKQVHNRVYMIRAAIDYLKFSSGF